MDNENEQKYNQLKDKFESIPDHNSLICGECHHKSNYLINIEVNDDDILFKFNNCHHVTNLNKPLYMVNNRILPDLSVLPSRILTKLVSLGYFKNFEIMIPTFLLDASDKLSSKEVKQGIQNEINTLASFENENLISIYHCRYERYFPKEELEDIEDNVILKLAHYTNSILFTQDKNLQSKSIIQKRPTIFTIQITMVRLKKG